jgi:hypothetical protein
MKIDTSRLPRSPWVYIGAAIALVIIIGLWRKTFVEDSGLGRKTFVEEPVSLSKRCESQSRGNDCYIWRLTITSKDDIATIKNVLANRGHCSTVNLEPQLPHMLPFGETFEILYQCNPTEVQVTTGKGSFAFTFHE